jgi:hypothetical protein
MLTAFFERGLMLWRGLRKHGSPCSRVQTPDAMLRQREEFPPGSDELPP